MFTILKRVDFYGCFGTTRKQCSMNGYIHITQWKFPESTTITSTTTTTTTTTTATATTTTTIPVLLMVALRKGSETIAWKSSVLFRSNQSVA